MNSARAASPPDGSNYGTRQPTNRIFGEFCPCVYLPKRFRVTWTLISCFEIVVLAFALIVYFFVSKKALQEIGVDKDSTKTDVINELSEWLLRLYASTLVMQIALLVCGMTFGDVNARKIIYWGILTGNILSVAIFAAFVHSMSRWNTANISFVAVLSMFGLIKVVVLVLNPVWWVWKTVPHALYV